MRSLFLILVFCVGCGSVPAPKADGGNPNGKENGETCAAGGDCKSGACVDGVCCNEACTGQCEACNVEGSAGTCGAVTGPPVGSRTACAGGGDVCGLTCNGTLRDQCEESTLPCGTGTCVGTMAMQPPLCSGGSCGTSQPLDCTTTTDTKMCGADRCAGVIDLALGLFHSCALLSDGTVRCWGQNFRGVLGLGGTDLSNKLKPTPVPGLTNVKKISTSPTNFTMCALIGDGTVKCWGGNQYGQLGINSMDTGNHTSPAPVLASGDGTPLAGIKDISVGDYHVCALKTDSTVLCWGWGLFGRVADGNATDHKILLPQPIMPATTLGDKLVTGGGHTMLLVGTNTSAQYVCWGVDGNGQCGITATSSVVTASSPTSLFDTINGTVARPLAGGNATSCAIINNGTLHCWGYNMNGELGRAGGGGTSSSTHAPVCRNNVNSCPNLADQLQGVTQATAGDNHVCALAGGLIKCWGGNTYGQLGNGTTTPQNYAANGPTISPAPTLVVAGGYHTCAILTDRTIRCWGENDFGQLGNDMMTASNTGIPSPVTPVWN
jgi:alpha-tubulin suppressor-like RCC1 family protein